MANEISDIVGILYPLNAVLIRLTNDHDDDDGHDDDDHDDDDHDDDGDHGDHGGDDEHGNAFSQLQDLDYL